jgi:hypothetical protein
MLVYVQLFAGLLWGYLLASLSESFYHRHILHAGSRARKFWKRYPRLTTPLMRAYYSHHVIHHARTYRTDFVTQFSSKEEQERLDRSMPPEYVWRVKDERYGLLMKGWRVIFFLVPVLPLLPLTYLLFGSWVTLGAMPMLLAVYPLMSGWIHPMLHIHHDEMPHKTSRWETWLLKSKYLRRVVRHHYLHHRYINCNYNLLLGGDRLLGVHRDPTEKDLEDMSKEGLPLH